MLERRLTLSEMASIQNELNEFTVKDWRKELNINDFKVAIFDECAELLNSGSWKWWKHAEGAANIWNMKIEMIDILHFTLSIYIIKDTVKEHKDFIFGNYNNTRNILVNDDQTINRNVFNRVITGVFTNDIPMMMDDLFDSIGLQAVEIAAIYAAKSELNFIRQDQGYKDGTYVKVQDGLEDNERFKDIVKDFIDDNKMSLDDVRQAVRDRFFVVCDEEKEEEKVA